MILVAGDAMVDRYWFGEVSRISPEAPVPVVRVVREEERPGAAANVARNVVAMGAACETVFSPSSEPVRKIRVIGRAQQIVRVDFDVPQSPIDPDEFEGKLAAANVVVLSDYDKGALRDARTLVSRAKALGKAVLVDPKGHDYAKYHGADLVKPNLNEMRELVGGWGSEDELRRKAERVMRDARIRAILLTRAEAGMTLYDAQAGVTQIPALAKEVYDVSGAGDTAIAAFAVALENGRRFDECAFYANRAAGVVVARFGTAVATQGEVFG